MLGLVGTHIKQTNKQTTIYFLNDLLQLKILPKLQYLKPTQRIEKNKRIRCACDRLKESTKKR